MKIARTLLFGISFLVLPVWLYAQGDAARGCGPGTKLADSLSSAEAGKAEQFLAALKTAVAANDKASVASMVQFPVRAYTLNHGHRIFANAAAFTAQFDQIFNAEVRQALQAQVPACMFANYRGVMIGDGQIWFREDGKGTYRIASFNHAR